MTNAGTILYRFDASGEDELLEKIDWHLNKWHRTRSGHAFYAQGVHSITITWSDVLSVVAIVVFFGRWANWFDRAKFHFGVRFQHLLKMFAELVEARPGMAGLGGAGLGRARRG